MRYWWASQGKNYQHVAHRGNLWSCPSGNGYSRTDRELIQELAPGDWVFHYGAQHLRAVSEVTAAWKPYPRPPHYERQAGEGDDGWLVTTVPTVTELEIHFTQLAEVVTHGSPGPLDRNGRPKQRFLSELASRDAAGLIQLIDDRLSQSVDDDSSTASHVWTGGSTSVLRESLARREQSALRDHLLNGRVQAKCALCGRMLPADLLVAAHILPRHLLDETQRRDLSRIAMLACVLGCDALFERGYIVVDDTGIVRDLAAPGFTDISTFTSKMAGRPCSAFTEGTADKFTSHRARSQRDPADS